MQPRGAGVEEGVAQLRGDLCADPVGFGAIVSGLADPLDQPRRNFGARHLRHPRHLGDIGDGHDARDHRLVDAEVDQFVDQRKVMIDLEEELGDGEVGLTQLGSEVLAVFVAVRRPWVQLRVRSHTDREPTEVDDVVDQLAGVAILADRRRVGISGRVAAQGQDVLDTLGAVVDQDVADVLRVWP